jgi:hypothetical protein
MDSSNYSIAETVDGIAHVWDVRLPQGGRAEVRILPTRATYFMGGAREVPPQLAWRALEAIGSNDARAFAGALVAAADKAETLPASACRRCESRRTARTPMRTGARGGCRRDRHRWS